jgi:hypothetical protein
MPFWSSTKPHGSCVLQLTLRVFQAQPLVQCIETPSASVRSSMRKPSLLGLCAGTDETTDMAKRAASAKRDAFMKLLL